MRVPSTNATMARPATTRRVLFSNPINAATPMRSVNSPVEIAKRPAGGRSKARDDGEPEPGHRHRGESEDAGVRDHCKVEDHERSRERGDERMDVRQVKAAVEQPANGERD